jgi:parvulin-like peptidyl-prolyl isomerase
MVFIFVIFSMLFSPSETELFKTLFLIKYSQEYNLYKNDINFNESELKTLIKKELEDRLILFEESQKTIKFNKDVYFQKIFDLKQQYNTKSLEFIAVKNNIPKKIILKNLEIDTYIEEFLRHLFKDVKVTDKEIENYYFSNLDDFTIKKNILLYQIFSSSMPKIIEIEKELDIKSQNFEELANKYSEAPEKISNGLIGWVSAADLPSYFTLAFKVKKGRYSGVIQSSIGYHIFYVKDIKQNQYVPIKSVKNKIKQELFSQKQEVILNDFLTKKRTELTQ